MTEFLALLGASLLVAVILAVSITGPAAALYRRGVNGVLALGAGMTASALAAWLCFFAFVAHPAFGTAVQLLMLAGFAWLLWSHRAVYAGSEARADIMAPVLGALSVGILLLLITFGSGQHADYLIMAATAYSHPLPDDNQLPFVFAEMIRSGELRSPMRGDWLSSDRPPLQTGMVLLYGPPGISGGSVLFYQTVSTLAQTWALIGCYVLARSLGAGRVAGWMAFALAAASPLFLVHAVFVWPKLLPAGLVCVTAALFFTRTLADVRLRASAGALAGLAAALSFGAHGATAFVLIGFALTALALHRIPSFAFSAAGLATFAASYLPWTLYQHFVDPPGNRLLKWHVGGSIPVDDRGVLETLVDSLRDVSAANWLYGRLLNLEQIVSDPWARFTAPVRLLLADDRAAMAEHLRAVDFFHWSAGLGLVAPILLLLPVALLLPGTRPLAAAIAASLLVWAALIFDPGGAVTHQGSFFPQLAVFALVGYAASQVGWRFAAILAGLQLVALALVYFVFS